MDKTINEKEPESVGEAIQVEIKRVRELASLYRSLDGGVGIPAAMLMEASIDSAVKALVENDVIAVLASYEDLRGYIE